MSTQSSWCGTSLSGSACHFDSRVWRSAYRYLGLHCRPPAPFQPLISKSINYCHVLIGMAVASFILNESSLQGAQPAVSPWNARAYASSVACGRLFLLFLLCGRTCALEIWSWTHICASGRWTEKTSSFRCLYAFHLKFPWTTCF
jgi:hypothetical protein